MVEYYVCHCYQVSLSDVVASFQIHFIQFILNLGRVKISNPKI